MLTDEYEAAAKTQSQFSLPPIQTLLNQRRTAIYHHISKQKQARVNLKKTNFSDCTILGQV